MNSLLNLLLEICKSNSVATAAGFSLGDWSHHVQISYNENEFASATNLGRLPMICIKEVSGDYEFTNHEGGRRETTMMIRIYGRCYRKRMASTVNKLNNIKTAILSGCFGTALNSLNANITSPTLIDNAVYIDLTFTSETVYGSDFVE